MNKTFWSVGDGQLFECLAEWTMDDEPDVWVKYRNTLTGREYSCRKEAFLSRFTRQPQPENSRTRP